MSLVTRCPKCQSGFEVTPDQLRLHDGLVRCGQCAHVFDGYAQLQAALPTLTRKVADARMQDSEPEESDLEESDPIEGRQQQPMSSLLAQRVRILSGSYEPDGADANDGVTHIMPVRHTDLTDELSEPEDMQEPSFTIRATPRLDLRAMTTQENPAETTVRVMGEARIRTADPSSPGRREPEFMDERDDEGWRVPSVIWMLLAVILSVTLLLQLVIYFRNDIATAVPVTRGALEQLCQKADCEVSLVRRPDRIVIIGSSLQQREPDAAQKAAKTTPYVLKLTLQNRHDKPQPWPSLLLTLSDTSGTAVIRKVLHAQQYLPPAMLSRPFAARQEVALDIPLVVYGHQISGFEVQRFFP